MTSNIDFFKQNLPNLAQSAAGAFDLFQGANMIAQGGNIQAQAFRTAGASSLAAANYNIALDKIQTNRRLDASARNLQRVLGQQRSAAIHSGFASTSKSTLMVMHETMNEFEKQVMHTRTDAAQRQAAILFEGQSRQVAAENKARAAEFRAQSEASALRRKGISGIVSQVGTLLGGIK